MHLTALKIRREANVSSLSLLQSLINAGLTLDRYGDKAGAAGTFSEATFLSTYPEQSTIKV